MNAAPTVVHHMYYITDCTIPKSWHIFFYFFIIFIFLLFFCKCKQATYSVDLIYNTRLHCVSASHFSLDCNTSFLQHSWYTWINLPATSGTYVHPKTPSSMGTHMTSTSHFSPTIFTSCTPAASTHICIHNTGGKHGGSKCRYTIFRYIHWPWKCSPQCQMWSVYKAFAGGLEQNILKRSSRAA